MINKVLFPRVWTSHW